MMEKTPSSVRRGRRRGERMWMPEKAKGCKGDGSSVWGSGEWRVVSDEEEERFLASLGMTVWWGLEMTVFLLSMRRPRSWLRLSKRRGREVLRDWTARVARV